MMRLLSCLMITTCLGGLSRSVVAQIVPRPTTVIEHVRVKTMDGPDIADGVVVIRGDRIIALGLAEDVQVPPRARRIDGAGRTLTPGLIDVLSGVARTGSGGNAAIHRAFDAFDRYARPQVEQAWREGVTTVFLSAGGSSGVNGTGAVVSLADSPTGAIGELLGDEVVLCIGLEEGSATARLRAFDSLRGQFKAAQAYRESVETYEEELAEYEEKLAQRAQGEETDPQERPQGSSTGRGSGGRGSGISDLASLLQDPRRRRGGRGGRGGGQPPAGNQNQQSNQGNQSSGDLKKPNEPAPNRNAEILLRAMDAELPVRIRADRSETILNALDLAKEFGLRITVEGGDEAHLVATELAERGVSVIYDSAPGGSAYRTGDSRRFTPDAPAILGAAGVTWSVGTGSANNGVGRFVLLNAMLASGSAPRQAPLGLVTSEAADVLGMSEIGRLRVGNRADLVLWSGEPTDPGSQVEQVFVGGNKVYERGLDQ